MEIGTPTGDGFHADDILANVWDHAEGKAVIPFTESALVELVRERLRECSDCWQHVDDCECFEEFPIGARVMNLIDNDYGTVKAHTRDDDTPNVTVLWDSDKETPTDTMDHEIGEITVIGEFEPGQKVKLAYDDEGEVGIFIGYDFGRDGRYALVNWPSDGHAEHDPDLLEVANA